MKPRELHLTYPLWETPLSQPFQVTDETKQKEELKLIFLLSWAKE